MRRVLPLLMLIAVLLGGLHLGVDAHAHEIARQHGLEQGIEAAHEAEDTSPSGEVAHQQHHHCPAMADRNDLTALCERRAPGGLLFARPIAALRSLTQAPPIEPPLA